MKSSLRLALLASGCVVAFAANAANIVVNPDFTSGIDGWTRWSPSGTVSLDSSDGLPAAPSLHIISDPGAGNAAASSTCMTIDDAGARYDFSMNAKGATGTVAASVVVYSDAACSTVIDSINSESFSADRTWHTYGLSNIALPFSTRSAQVVIAAGIGSLGEVGDAIFDHIEFGPTGSLKPINIDQEGLTGTYYNPNTDGQGIQIAISADESNPGQGSLFGAWYTYALAPGDTDTQRWYSFDASLDPDAQTANVTIYQNVGGNFAMPPSTDAVAVGTGTLTFDTCTTGTFTYILDDGRSGAIPLISLLPNVECVETGTPSNPPSDFGLSGAWYNTDTSGQGILVDVNPVDSQAFFGWYTYALDGENAGESGQRWFSAQTPYTVGSTSLDFTVYASAGGAFDSSGPPVTTNAVGTANLTYSDCDHATLTYTFTSGEFAGENGTIALTRLGSALMSCGL